MLIFRNDANDAREKLSEAKYGYFTTVAMVSGTVFALTAALCALAVTATVENSADPTAPKDACNLISNLFPVVMMSGVHKSCMWFLRLIASILTIVMVVTVLSIWTTS
ncbi:hypothetical protein B9Z55_005699 [Caenorhabditis nigoni]|uniref:Uncharacterized protein n=1 Tax=Caenorhabditis nigoni TaxID=1611254 RepID=A0A2G5V2S4_9PELO|nr:hypothetical protein B9Z55_005699 [Caenorhabditis nigoni]